VKTTLPHNILHEMSRHLPPSASELTVLDLGGNAAVQLLEARPDLRVITLDQTSPPIQTMERGARVACIQGDQVRLPLANRSVDAITGYEVSNHDRSVLLQEALRILRPGGRLILFDRRPSTLARIGQRRDALEQAGSVMEEAGFARVLVEQVGEGLLARGEKPYPNLSTTERIAATAVQDNPVIELQILDSADLARIDRVRFVFLLVRQTPDKPPWAIQPGEPIRWDAAMVNDNVGRHYLLAFTSLPKAVEFMQPAVIAGLLKAVNKVGKFERAAALRWAVDVLLNPPFELLRSSGSFAFAGAVLPVEPASAVTGEE
jgi:SAM-dependent methyltransferase